MHPLRAFIRGHRSLAIALVALALCVKALVPAGYMVAPGSRVITIQICADTQGTQLARQLAIPTKAGHPLEDRAGHGKSEGACAFSALALASLAGADAALLAAALLFILGFGLRPAVAANIRPARYQRPPLRGPPLPA